MQAHIVGQFQVISDVHLERIHRGMPDVDISSPYLIIAGDLGFPNHKIYWDFLRDVSSKARLVFLVLGSKEYCSAEFTFVPRFVRTQIARMRLTNVIFLDNSTFDFSVEVPGGEVPLRILGSTLWSFIPTPSTRYKKIQVKHDSGYVPFDTICNLMHLGSVDWLNAEITRCAEDGRHAVVVTHYLPSNRLIHTDYAMLGQSINAYYAAELDFLIRPPVLAWFFGRTHARGLLNVYGVPCLVGAVGYVGESIKLYAPSANASGNSEEIQKVSESEPTPERAQLRRTISTSDID